MTAVQTPLDIAHSAMDAEDSPDQAARDFYKLLADQTLFLLLNTEASGETVSPKVFELEDGPVVLAFDTEDRLASLGAGPAPYAALPGRVVAQQLEGHGISLGLNLGTGAASETLLPPEALQWLVEMLSATPKAVDARPVSFYAPTQLPESLHTALTRTAQDARGLAVAAALVGVVYEGGRRGHMLAVLGAAPSAEPALARAVSEALGFCGLEAAELDVTFLSAQDESLAAFMPLAQIYEIPAPDVADAPVAPAAPGTNPAKPPKLR